MLRYNFISSSMKILMQKKTKKIMFLNPIKTKCMLIDTQIKLSFEDKLILFLNNLQVLSVDQYTIFYTNVDENLNWNYQVENL